MNKIVEELTDRMASFDESERKHEMDCKEKGINLKSYSLGYEKTKEMYCRIVVEIERLERG